MKLESKNRQTHNHRDSNTPLSVIDGTRTESIRRPTPMINIYGPLLPKTTEYILFSRAHGTFTKISIFWVIKHTSTFKITKII